MLPKSSKNPERCVIPDVNGRVDDVTDVGGCDDGHVLGGDWPG